MANIPKNTDKHANKPLTDVRRPDNEITDESWISDLLLRGAYGTLGTSHKEQPFLSPVLYVYEQPNEAIYFHTAKTGRTRANIELNPKVSFCVTEIGRILPHQDAVDFNVEYNSVVVFGKASVIEDKDSERRALQILLDKYAPDLHPGQDYNPIQPEGIKRTTVYKIEIEEWSAKQQKESADYPGAFYYEHAPAIRIRSD